jgi:hypothetical protein
MHLRGNLSCICNLSVKQTQIDPISEDFREKIDRTLGARVLPA